MNTPILYGSDISGNTYKVRLTAALLGVDYQYHRIDLLAGEHKSPEFLSINPLGQVPTLVINENNDSNLNNPSDKPTILLESNAIIYYLAKGSYLIPTEPVAHAKLLQWLFYEQAEIKNNLAVIRFIKRFQKMPADRQAEYEEKLAKSQAILNYLDQQLKDSSFLLGDTLSLADISLYVYTHLAGEGGLDLANYSHLQVWFKRIEELPNFEAM